MTDPNEPVYRDAEGKDLGLTKRELFAAMALQGYCGNSGMKDEPNSRMAAWAVNAADELIKFLNREEKA